MATSGTILGEFLSAKPTSSEVVNLMIAPTGDGSR